MGRRKVIAPVADIPAEEESQESPDPDFLTPEESIRQAEQENFALNGTPSKAAIVREALSSGCDSPGDIVDYAKRVHNVEITKMAASSYKAQQKARDGKGGEPRTRTTTPAPTQYGIPHDFPADIKRVKGLIDKAGSSEQLSELIGDIAMLIGKYGERGLQDLVEAFA